MPKERKNKFDADNRMPLNAVEKSESVSGNGIPLNAVEKSESVAGNGIPLNAVEKSESVAGNGMPLNAVEKSESVAENGIPLNVIEKSESVSGGGMPQNMSRKREGKPLPVVMCIGSDRVSGDLLGPAVGRKLIEEYNLRAYVYGTTGRNINGANIDFYDGFIREIHKESKVVAVDACLGSGREIGKIKIGYRGVGAGYAVRKAGKRYGDVGIVGIVAENAEDNVMQLISVEVSLIEEMSGRIAEYLANNLDALTGE